MKHLKTGCLFVLLVSLLSLSIPEIGNADENMLKRVDEVEVIIEKGKEKDKPKEKDTIYKPKEAKPVRILPQTGEVIVTFIYLIIGLSILLFVMGVTINGTKNKYLSWEH